ncbi:hypothetical protein BKA63DRAFT_547980 [Paraphoma chrysanthemicola]|nr:hypothetical protein BKA63DRAFT_547980 [Paraphoma chrysanthemicola]
MSQTSPTSFAVSNGKTATMIRDQCNYAIIVAPSVPPVMTQPAPSSLVSGAPPSITQPITSSLPSATRFATTNPTPRSFDEPTLPSPVPVGLPSLTTPTPSTAEHLIELNHLREQLIMLQRSVQDNHNKWKRSEDEIWALRQELAEARQTSEKSTHRDEVEKVNPSLRQQLKEGNWSKEVLAHPVARSDWSITGLNENVGMMTARARNVQDSDDDMKPSVVMSNKQPSRLTEPHQVGNRDPTDSPASHGRNQTSIEQDESAVSPMDGLPIYFGANNRVGDITGDKSLLDMHEETKFFASY